MKITMKSRLPKLYLYNTNYLIENKLSIKPQSYEKRVIINALRVDYVICNYGLHFDGPKSHAT